MRLTHGTTLTMSRTIGVTSSSSHCGPLSTPSYDGRILGSGSCLAAHSDTDDFDLRSRAARLETIICLKKVRSKLKTATNSPSPSRALAQRSAGLYRAS
ncbi:hypothetical protein HPB50_023406 [Hyalomma asiaticum]|uniref:Uncharacterized protein n=1 Tax=Hyalomma asiaticum TaxID=266040 RepID=A0ACB7S2X6_HYAAI|nr:hypothetical protein HPB50_023406 [Hyalomma asiaticum]